MISAKFVPLKYYTLSSELRRLTSFSVGLFGSANSVTRSYPVMRKSCITVLNIAKFNYNANDLIGDTFRPISFYAVSLCVVL